MSIHSGDECVYQSVLGGRGEKEKVGAKKLVLFQRKHLTQTIISVFRAPPPPGSGKAGQRMLCIVRSTQELGLSTIFLRWRILRLGRNM